jgi:ferredoxin
MTSVNAEVYRLTGWKTITKRKSPLPDADEWKDQKGKLSQLQR